jgi:hypothetical protein
MIKLLFKKRDCHRRWQLALATALGTAFGTHISQIDEAYIE